jgi:Ca2+-binding EF-hand superfamily protein
MIRRRYNSKKDFHRIFKQWNKSSNGELSPSEAQEMLNKFGIALNLNEIKILLSTGSRRGKETLNLDEFIQFVFPENINNNSNYLLIKVTNTMLWNMEKR